MANPMKRLRGIMSLLPEVQLNNHRCLRCGEEFNAASGTETAVPRPGDASICVFCGNLAMFTKDGLGPWPKDVPVPDDVQAAMRTVARILPS